MTLRRNKEKKLRIGKGSSEGAEKGKGGQKGVGGGKLGRTRQRKTKVQTAQNKLRCSQISLDQERGE